jgi:plastocyanin
MHRRLTLAVVLALLVFGLASCGGSDDDDDAGDGAAGDTTAETAAGSAKAQEFTVRIDGESDAFNGEFAAFFPKKLAAHPGDTVTFSLPRFSGVPHTVTFGSLVDAALTKFRALPPTASVADTENFPEMIKVTDVFPHEPPQGPPVPNQSAAQPCYLGSGEPPNNLKGGAPACAKVTQPEFDGTQTFYNSGVLLQSGDEFTMKIAEDTKPGDYGFMCLIHRGGMSGTLSVADADTKVPAPAQVEKAGDTELAALVEVGKKALAAGASATADKAMAGTGDPKNPDLIVAEFLPKEISIKAGGSVTWNMFAFHTVSLNAKDSDVGVIAKSPDGSFAFLPSGAPSGFAPDPALGSFPPPADSKPVLVDGGTWDGTGSRSTGILGSLPPRFIAVKQTFSKPGTYTVRCLVHPEMKATVKVA